MELPSGGDYRPRVEGFPRGLGGPSLQHKGLYTWLRATGGCLIEPACYQKKPDQGTPDIRRERIAFFRQQQLRDRLLYAAER